MNTERRRKLARDREKKREKQTCVMCDKDKICRYGGPTCGYCYTRHKNPKLHERVLISNKKYKETDRGRFVKIKSQAKDRGKEFFLSEVFYKKMTNKPCFYCNKEFDGGVWADRIDNNKGYLEDNVLPCCGSCNHIRNVHLTVEEMKVAMAAVLAYRIEGNDD